MLEIIGLLRCIVFCAWWLIKKAAKYFPPRHGLLKAFGRQWVIDIVSIVVVAMGILFVASVIHIVRGAYMRDFIYGGIHLMQIVAHAAIILVILLFPPTL